MEKEDFLDIWKNADLKPGNIICINDELTLCIGVVNSVESGYSAINLENGYEISYWGSMAELGDAVWRMYEHDLEDLKPSYRKWTNIHDFLLFSSKLSDSKSQKVAKVIDGLEDEKHQIFYPCTTLIDPETKVEYLYFEETGSIIPRFFKDGSIVTKKD